MFEEHNTPETIIIFGRLLYLCLYIFHCSFDVFNFISFYSLIYVSHVSDVFVFLFLYTFIMYLDYHCFVYVVYVLFFVSFHH